MMQSNKKCSIVRDFFDEKFLDDSKAVCKLCNDEISCSSQKERRFTTSTVNNFEYVSILSEYDIMYARVYRVKCFNF